MKPRKPERSDTDDLFRAPLPNIINAEHPLMQLRTKLGRMIRDIDRKCAPLFTAQGWAWYLFAYGSSACHDRP
jgi:hypothetical protein